MSTLQTDVAEVRRATRDLAAAVERLSRSHPPTLDLRRLAEDVARVSADLDLLTGSPPTPRSGLRGGSADTDYDPRQFGDGAYEDFGRPS